MTFVLQAATLLLSSLLSFTLISYRFSVTTLQQVVVGGLIILMIMLDRFVFKAERSVNFALRLSLLFLISAFVQLLILSTGGFYSPFLVLFHLLAIALSFLLSLKIAATYLIFSVSALLMATFLDERLSLLLNQDYASVALYLLSFMVIVPLSSVVAQRYHLKDTLSKLLSHQLTVQRQVLEGLSDMVIITDTSLKILSFNEAVSRGLRLSPSEVTDRFLFEVLLLRDLKDQVVNEQYLSIAEVLQDKATRIVKNLLLYVKNSSIPKTANIQIRPTANLEGKIDQIAFIISDATSAGKGTSVHSNLQQALLQHEAILEELKKDFGQKAELLGRAENDILLALEIQDHGLTPVVDLKDVAQILPHIISQENLFAKALGVQLQFKIDDKYTQQAVKLMPQASNFAPSMVTSPFFTIPIDGKWFDLLVQKLLDITILLVSGTKFPQVLIFLTYDNECVYVSFVARVSGLMEVDTRLLFTEYYGRLGATTNLRLGSGLEGYMAKTAASLLGIPVSAKVNNQSVLEFKLKFPKKPLLS